MSRKAALNILHSPFRAGVIIFLVSYAIRLAFIWHTPVEAIHLKDLENLAVWLSHFLLDLSPQETFKVKI